MCSNVFLATRAERQLPEDEDPAIHQGGAKGADGQPSTFSVIIRCDINSCAIR